MGERRGGLSSPSGLGGLEVLCPPPSVVESTLFLFLLDAFDIFVLDLEENLARLVIFFEGSLFIPALWGCCVLHLLW